MKGQIIENVNVALRSIKSQLLRTVITVLIIALGITALVGILTAIDSIKAAINQEFTQMGANTFTIRNRTSRIGREGQKAKRYREITYKEAAQFRDNYGYPSTLSVSTLATWDATLKYKDNKTNPNITVFGGDENYLVTSGYEVAQGRNFTANEIANNAHVVVIGREIWTNLFEGLDAIDKVISIGNSKYTVIGVLKEKGSSLGFGGDRQCIIPLGNVRQYFSTPDQNFTVNVMVNGPHELEASINEATGLFRVIRKVQIGDEDSFEMRRSDNLASILIENIRNVTVITIIVGIITLLGAAIALMNIMLVSITERTREIGIRKAIGANKGAVLIQFLMEAVVICLLGGILGIVLGIAAGNGVSALVGVGFIVPWDWMLLGITLCVIVGLISGIYPATKAAKLDPIEALRYE